MGLLQSLSLFVVGFFYGYACLSSYAFSDLLMQTGYRLNLWKMFFLVSYKIVEKWTAAANLLLLQFFPVLAQVSRRLGFFQHEPLIKCFSIYFSILSLPHRQSQRENSSSAGYFSLYSLLTCFLIYSCVTLYRSESSEIFCRWKGLQYIFLVIWHSHLIYCLDDTGNLLMDDLYCIDDLYGTEMRKEPGSKH